MASLGASWRALGASWAPLGPLLGRKGAQNRNLAIMEREARSTREPQALQTTQNTRREARTTRETRAQGHEEQQSRRGESNASIQIASGVDRCMPLLGRCAAFAGRLELGPFRALASVPTCFEASPKMAPKCCPEPPKSSQNGSRRPPGGHPESPTEDGDLFCSLFSPLGRLLGSSWGALGASWGRFGASWAAPQASRGAPGVHLGLPGASFSEVLGLCSMLPCKIAKTLKSIVFSIVSQGFWGPGGFQSP